MARKVKANEPPGSAESLLIDGDTWEATAWRLWTVEGKRRIGALTASLQKEFPNAPKDTRTVRAGIERISQAIALVQRQGLISANAEYICSLEAMLDKALTMHRTADNDSAGVAALKAAVDLHEKIAAAKGVVTERKAAEVTGANGAPLFGGMTDEQLEALVASTAAGDPGGTGDASDSEAGGAVGD